MWPYTFLLLCFLKQKENRNTRCPIHSFAYTKLLIPVLTKSILMTQAERERERYKLCKVHSCVCPCLVWWYLISQLGVLDYKDLRVVNHIVHKSLIKCAKSKGKIEKVETQIVYKLVHTSDLKNCRESQPLAHTLYRNGALGSHS